MQPVEAGPEMRLGKKACRDYVRDVVPGLLAEITRLAVARDVARAELAELTETAARQAEELGRTRDVLGVVRDTTSRLQAERDSARTRSEVAEADLARLQGVFDEVLANLRRYSGFADATIPEAVEQLRGQRDEALRKLEAALRRRDEALGRCSGLSDELHATQHHRDLMCAKAEAAVTACPPGWDSVEQIHATYLDLLRRYEAAEKVQAAALAWRTVGVFGSGVTAYLTTGAREFWPLLRALVDAVDTTAALPLPDGVAAHVGRLQLELYRAQRYAAIRDNVGTARGQAVEQAQAELAEKTKQLRDLTARVVRLSDRAARLTAERADLAAMVGRLEQLPARWRGMFRPVGGGFAAELRAAISGGRAWESLMSSEKAEDRHG